MEHPSFDRILTLTRNPCLDLRKEAYWVVCNAVSGVDFEVRRRILTKGGDDLISSLVTGLFIQDTRLLMNVLEAFDSLLQLDWYFGLKNTEDSVAYMIERNEGVAQLEEVQKHPNKNIYDMVSEILQKHFDGNLNGMNDSVPSSSEKMVGNFVI